MARRPCLDCGTLTTGTRCAPCASERGKARDARRGSARQRGYGTEHDKLRERWRPRVERGGEPCARCGQPIPAGGPWALDHTDDRTGYLGPSHKACNDSAGGKAAHPSR